MVIKLRMGASFNSPMPTHRVIYLHDNPPHYQKSAMANKEEQEVDDVPIILPTDHSTLH